MKLKLISIKDEAHAVKSFFWKPESKISFLPGQYFYYTLPKLNYDDSRGATRHFTISSSPSEEYLELTTKIRPESGYKKTLAELPIGSTIEGEGPMGTFTLEGYEFATNIFIAGGIGITPFRSMVKEIMDKNLPTKINLIYSNSDSDFIYKNELTEWSIQNRNLKISWVDSSAEGHLDKDKLKKYLEKLGTGIDNSVFWITGPPNFVDALEESVTANNVSDEHIKTEKFTGY